MGGGAAIGVDDDLATGQAGITVGTPDLEGPGGVDMPLGFVGQPACRQDLADYLFHIGLKFGLLRPLVIALGVLGRDDDRRAGDRLAVFIAQRDLALGIGLEEGRRAVLAVLGQALQDLVAVIERRGHEVGRLVAGEPEHDALVAGALIFVAAGIHALRNFGGLAVQMVLEGQRLPVEAVLLIADFAHRAAHRFLDFFLRAGGPAGVFRPVGIVGVVHRGATDLAREDNTLRGRHGLASHACFGVLGQHQIDDRIRNLVGNLVGMAFRNAFGSEQITGAHEGANPDIKKSLCVLRGVASCAAHGNQR